jgi:ABC-type nitrate/sulfonate/bicarbonate transport system substrate-binding protein
MVSKLKHSILPIIGGCLILLIAACGDSAKKNHSTGSLKQASLREDWSGYAGYAGELIAADETDSVYGLDLKVEAGSESVSPIKMVIAGSNTFGVTGASAVLAADEKGADLVIIAVLNYKSPVCFLSLGDKIQKPKDFIGKNIGVNFGGASEMVYRTLLNKQNISRQSLKETPIPFDLATFLTGVYDVRPAFIYSEPIVLDSKGVKYSVIKPDQYNVNFLGQVYFTKRETIQKDPALVQAFVNAICDGWRSALKNPKKGIVYLKIFDGSINEKNELASLNKAEDYFAGENGKILWVSDPKWKDMLLSLKELKVISSVDNANKFMNLSFVNNYHKN